MGLINQLVNLLNNRYWLIVVRGIQNLALGIPSNIPFSYLLLFNNIIYFAEFYSNYVYII